MVQKKEKLQDEVVQKLRELQTKTNESIIFLGETELRLRDLEKQIEIAKSVKEKVVIDYDDAVNQLNTQLKALEISYPKGEIDLVEGVVTYEVSE